MDAALPGLVPSPDGTPALRLAGADEAGRGPLAGPVVAAAVILPDRPRIPGLGDSKALSSAKRSALFDRIRQVALAHAVCVVEPAEIDELNILGASMKAVRTAVQALPIRPDLLLMDGHLVPRTGLREMAIVKGDGKSACIMAASILAKVTRDRIMEDLDGTFPQYGFRDHKGYGCETHLQALRRHGPCPAHRRSFAPVRSLLKEATELFSA